MIENTRLYCVETTWPDAFLAKMALQCIPRHAGDSKEQVYLHPTNAESRLQSRRYLCPEHHPPQPETLPEFTMPKLLICRPDIRICIYIFPVLYLLLSMHLPRIARMIQILIEICLLMKEQPLVSKLSAVWQFS